MKINGDTITFSSGRTAYATNGIVGLSAPRGGDEWLVSEGYDGGIWSGLEEEGRDDGLSKEDLRELAEYMIALWGRFLEEVTK